VSGLVPNIEPYLPLPPLGLLTVALRPCTVGVVSTFLPDVDTTVWIRGYRPAPTIRWWSTSLPLGLRGAHDPCAGCAHRTSLKVAPPNWPLQRTWSSLTLGTTPLNAEVVGQLRDAMLKLEAPSENLQAEFSDMAADFARHGESRYDRASQDFEGFLRQIASEEHDRVLAPGRVPDSQFWLVSDGRVVGCSRLRHWLTEELEYEGGHIGYDIRPSDRGRGLGTNLLRLTIARAAALGIVKVRLTCDAGNQASIRVIEKNGGRLEAIVRSRTRNKMICQYWIGVGVGRCRTRRCSGPGPHLRSDQADERQHRWAA
jgi:predicted acetyltransferase